MKKFMFVLCGFVVAGVILTALAAEQKQTPQAAPTTADIEKLAKKIDALQAKVKTLEEKVEKLEHWKVSPIWTFPPLASNSVPQTLSPPRGFTLPPGLTLPHPKADANRPPNAWGEREFNGLTYYIVPLSGGEN